MFVEALVLTMLGWKTPEEPDDSRTRRYTPLVSQVYEQCQRYEKRTKVSAITCTIVAVNTAYWETGLQEKYQLEPKSGPSGEECYFQIHRQAASIPFDEWRPKYEYGTRHGPDLTRCVHDGVRILSYHLWRCGITEKDLRGNDARAQLWHLYSEYYLPSENCWIFRSGHKSPIYRRAGMAKRLLKRFPVAEYTVTAPNGKDG